MKRKHKQGITCTVTAYQLDPPIDVDPFGRQEWIAVATAHRYHPNPDTGGLLTPEAAIIACEVVELVQGKGTAGTQEDAMRAAVGALVFQWDATLARRESES